MGQRMTGQEGLAYLPIIGLCGSSGAGKTTLVEALIPRFTARGIRVAVVKHGAHRVQVDVPGKDSDRLFRPGRMSPFLVRNIFFAAIQPVAFFRFCADSAWTMTWFWWKATPVHRSAKYGSWAGDIPRLLRMRAGSCIRSRRTGEGLKLFLTGYQSGSTGNVCAFRCTAAC